MQDGKHSVNTEEKKSHEFENPALKHNISPHDLKGLFQMVGTRASAERCSWLGLCIWTMEEDIQFYPVPEKQYLKENMSLTGI